MYLHLLLAFALTECKELSLPKCASCWPETEFRGKTEFRVSSLASNSSLRVNNSSSSKKQGILVWLF
ncbi:hypothetical protein Nepgr_000436 [Nepenthes gracilis]|uniref:Uncharacterized protein n=1 Tax=Nepenthes gracilis TaxID=150966 RepID=A0AAD3P6M3_NEPGR|nr:hypothetical protein Nepgr_000436 [Nepenthes gracilis]